MSLTPLVTERFIIPVWEENNRPKVFVAVKRYTPRLQSTRHQPSTGLSLVLTHGVSFHKELWEPTLTRLFDQQLQPGCAFRIREAWAIDSPNHGESASLNERLINSGFLLTYRDFARGVIAFFESGLIDIKRSTIIGIGHSAGSAPLIWAANKWYRAFHQSPFSALILLEPPIISMQLDAKYDHFNSMLAARAKRRRGTWSSKQEASMWIKKQQQKWDPQCAALFQEFGLRFDNNSVSLSCNGAQEAACYSVSEQDEVLNILKVRPLLMIHRNPEIRENIVDRSQGRTMASIEWMPGVGHFAPIENPGITSYALAHCLASISRGRPLPSFYIPNSARL
ncbi:hypothetical protein Clacol_002490 [Clathrus columnatus]|uniref:AB hydrolase-1 domain-containing protein n=1 Tax=Clathrus columnatus TaxID=1419009 RepID=A0AAV5A1Z9_9AGAM|nr:hypothetical protein Clacol_002490 [Clathrus columnatus]